MPTITKMILKTRGKVPGIDQATFEQIAEKAKKECVVSRALGGVNEMSVEATLES